MPKRRVTLTFPWPPKELSPNARPNRYAKASATREYREACGWLAVEQSLDEEHVTICLNSPVLAIVTFHVKDKHRRDIRNMEAALKPLWDGIVDAGILVDDDYKHLRHGESTVLVGKERKVVVVLEEVE